MVHDSQMGGYFDFVQKLRDGSLIAEVQFKTQVKQLLKLMQIHDRVTTPVGPNTYNGIIIQRNLRSMEDSKILMNTKDHSVMEVNCMAKQNRIVRTKEGD